MLVPLRFLGPGFILPLRDGRARLRLLELLEMTNGAPAD